jgi:hypothetical protein
MLVKMSKEQLSNEQVAKSKVNIPSLPSSLCSLLTAPCSLATLRAFLLSFFIFHCSLFICPAQTADNLTTLLQTSAITHEQAASLVLEAANIESDREDEESAQTGAFQYAAERNWLSKKADPSDTINLQQASLLIMRAFDIKGGLMYSLFKNPHYAYREMVYQELIQGRSDPRMAVSGEMLLFLVSRVLYRADDDPWALQGEHTDEATPEDK